MLTGVVAGACTWDAAVGGLEVGDEVLATRLYTKQFGIRHRDGAARPAATTKFNMVEHVGKTSDVVVNGQTTTNPHTTVASRRY